MDLEEPKLSQKKKQLNNYARYSSMAFQMMIIITIGSLGGLKLDEWIGLRFPVFTLIFSIASVVIAVYLAIKDVIRFNK